MVIESQQIGDDVIDRGECAGIGEWVPQQRMVCGRRDPGHLADGAGAESCGATGGRLGGQPAPSREWVRC